MNTVGFVYSLTLLYSPWAAMGLLPVVALYSMHRILVDASVVRQLFRFANIVFPVFLLLVVGSFYMSNNHPLADKGWFWNYENPLVFVGKYVVFITVEIGVYVYLLRCQLVKDWLLSAAVITLLLIPFYKMTAWNDFMMRASLPALFVVFMYWACWCLENWHLKRRLIITVTSLSSLTALQLMSIALIDTVKSKGAVLTNADERFCDTGNVGVAKLGEGQFFAHDYRKTFFWKYLADIQQ